MDREQTRTDIADMEDDDDFKSQSFKVEFTIPKEVFERESRYRWPWQRRFWWQFGGALHYFMTFARRGEWRDAVAWGRRFMPSWCQVFQPHTHWNGLCPKRDGDKIREQLAQR